MKTTLKTLLAAPLLMFAAACGTPAAEPGADCGEAESFESNGNTYCVASRAIIEKGFDCPPDMFDLNFGEVVVCSPNEQVPVPDQGPLYEYAQGQGGTGDPLQACQTPDPSADDCATDSDCAAGESCVDGDPEVDCRAGSCFCDPAEGTWGCTADCQTKRVCAVASASACQDPDPSEQDCDTDADCAQGQVCADLDTAVCVPSSCTCDESTGDWGCTRDCLPERACVAATAGETCTSDADCDPDKLCADGICAPFEPVECTTDAECMAGESCDTATNECVANATPCANDVDCGAGQICSQGVCEADPNTCTSDADCAAGQTCVDGVCT
jgi:Cys-rich repeat protein